MRLAQSCLRCCQIKHKNGSISRKKYSNIPGYSQQSIKKAHTHNAITEKERERERERERGRETERDRERDRETERQRERQRERKEVALIFSPVELHISYFQYL